MRDTADEQAENGSVQTNCITPLVNKLYTRWTIGNEEKKNNIKNYAKVA